MDTKLHNTPNTGHHHRSGSQLVRQSVGHAFAFVVHYSNICVMHSHVNFSLRYIHPFCITWEIFSNVYVWAIILYRWRTISSSKFKCITSACGTVAIAIACMSLIQIKEETERVNHYKVNSYCHIVLKI